MVMRLQIFIVNTKYEASSNYICLSVILIDSVLKKDENYFLQKFLKECKYMEKEKRMIRYITDDFKFSSDDSDESDQ